MARPSASWTCGSVEPWSAEGPRLYDGLSLKSGKGGVIEVAAVRVGFGHIERRDGLFFFNGVPVTVRGVTGTSSIPTMAGRCRCPRW